MITIKDAFYSWNSEIKPAVVAQYGADDIPALSESWNNYTDSLCKDGELTELQYNHCPAWDDEIPESDPAYILESMGVSIDVEFRRERPDPTIGDMPKGTTHWRILIRRAGETIELFYSMGPACTGEPELCEVFYSILADTSDIDSGYDFEEWAENLGFDPDSRRAESAFQACRRELSDLKRLFKESEISDLREIFQDY